MSSLNRLTYLPILTVLTSSFAIMGLLLTHILPVSPHFTKLTVVSKKVSNETLSATSSTTGAHSSLPEPTSTSSVTVINNRTGTIMYSAKRRGRNPADHSEDSNSIEGAPSEKWHTYIASQPTLRWSSITYPFLTSENPTTPIPWKLTGLSIQPVNLPIKMTSHEGGEDMETSASYKFAKYHSPPAPTSLSKYYPVVPAPPHFPSGPSVPHGHVMPTTPTFIAISKVPISTEHHQSPKHDGDKHKAFGLSLEQLAMIALLKMGLFQLKIFAGLKFIFLMILKFKLFLKLLFLKFLLFLKGFKLLKALLVPLILFLALSLLLMPLLALAALFAPLIQFLLQPVAEESLNINVPSPPSPSIKRLAYNIRGMGLEKMEQMSGYMNQLLDSETCIERVTCLMATNKQAHGWLHYVKWFLRKLKRNVRIKKFTRLVEAFIITAREFKQYQKQVQIEKLDAADWCKLKYRCEKKRQ